MAILRDLMTGKDGISHDIGRYIAAASSVTGLFLCSYAVIVKGQPFSFQDFGIGMGSLAAGVGALLKLKENTEPDCK